MRDAEVKFKRKNEQQNNEEELEERVVFINRCAKVLKGGRRFSFSALSVVGDKKGKVGIGFGKAKEVPEAIQKSMAQARKNMTAIALVSTTIPHDILAKFGAARVIMRPASPGTGVIAGGAVRILAECAGIKDLLAKSLGSDNKVNILKAAMRGLESLRTPEQVAKTRGKTLEDIMD